MVRQDVFVKTAHIHNRCTRYATKMLVAVLCPRADARNNNRAYCVMPVARHTTISLLA